MKRILALILSFAMILGMMPMAFAEGETVVAKIGEEEYQTITAAINAAQTGETVTLVSDVETDELFSVPSGIIIDGGGKTIKSTYAGNKANLITITGKGETTIQNLNIDVTEAQIKYAVHVYSKEEESLATVTLSKVKIEGGNYAAILVNGSEVTIEDSTLNPGENAYTNVEYAMGSNVTSVPKITLNNVTTKEGLNVMYADSDTLKAIDAESTEKALEIVNSNLVGAKISLDEDGNAYDFVEVKYQLTLNYADEQTESKEIEVIEGEEVELEVPTREGYTFEGWKAEDGTIYGKEEDKKSIKVESDIILTAEWKKIETEESGDNSGDTSGDVSGDISSDASGDVSGDISSDASGDVSGDISGDTSGDVSGDISGDTSGDVSGDISDDTSGDVSGDKSGDTSVDDKTSSGGKSSGKGDKKEENKEDNKEEEKTEVKITFDDIKSGDWYYESVKDLVGKGVIKGTSKDKFSPELKLTRGMLVTMLHRLENEEKATKKITFKDVNEKAYYYDAVVWAAENKIIVGYNEETFGAEDEITREQVALVLYRYQKYLDKDVKVKEDSMKFDDAKEISDYAKTAMQWAVEKGIMKGKDEKILAPKDISSRAEIVVMIGRLGK